MAVSKYELIDFYEMIGGLNTVGSSIALKNNEARDLKNIDLAPSGGITKRNGYAVLNSVSVGNNACTGLYMARYSLNGGTNIAYLVSGLKLFSMSSALGGTWTDITGGLTISSGNNNIWNFGILNDICVLGDGVDTPIQINSSGSASALSPGPFTSFKFCCESRGYMWYFQPIVGGITNYDRGYFSSINDPTTVGTNNYVDVAKGQGGDVRGAVDYKTYLYIFKRHGIYQLNFQPTRVDSTGTLFPWNQFPNPVVPGVGTQSHRSIVKFTTPATHPTPGMELVFFIDQFGVPRIFDGTTTISFASKIGSSRDTAILSLSNMDTTRTQYAFSINYPLKSKIFFFLSQANSQQDTCWVMNYEKGFSISKYIFKSAFNCGAIFEKSDGTFKPYVGDYAGTVYQLDQGTSDNGFPIDAYYTTGDIYTKSPTLQSRWYFMEMRGTTGSNTQNVTLNYYLDGGDSSVLTDTKTLADTQTQWGAGPPAMIWGQSSWAKLGLVARTSEVSLIGKTLRIKLQNSNLNETFIIEGWTIAAETLGTSQN